MKALALHTGSITLHLDYSTNVMCVVEAKIVTTIFKNIDILVFFLQ